MSPWLLSCGLRWAAVGTAGSNRRNHQEAWPTGVTGRRTVAQCGPSTPWAPASFRFGKGSPAPALALRGSPEQMGQACILSSVKTDHWCQRCYNPGKLQYEGQSLGKSGSAAEHDASLCLQSWPENAHLVRLLWKVKNHVKPRKIVDMETCNGYQAPIMEGAAWI